MRSKCYFCDTELEAVAHKFRFGPREEPVCEECNMKTVNRRKARQDEAKS